MKSSATFQKLLTLYVIGFGGALIASLVSYMIVTENWLGSATTLAAFTLLGLAGLQMIIQLVCFLHLGGGDRVSLFKTHIFIFTFITLLIVVVGTIWIMRNLDYRMGMSPEAMREYMLDQNKKGF